MLNIIDHLPRNSAYAEAIANDDELADLLVDSPDGDYAPAVADWSSELEVLVAMLDRLGDLISAVSVTSGGKPVRVKPWPRPLTAADRAVQRRKHNTYVDLVALVLPDDIEGG